jgi:acyl carrier protein
LSSTWKDVGLDELTYVEIMLEAENEFNLEFADEDLEKFQNI